MTRPTALKFLLAGLTGLTGFALQMQSQPAAVLPEGTILVDGVVDEDWDLVDSIALSEDLLDSSPADSDFSAYWKGYWDEDNLYVLLVTEDSTPTAYNPIQLDMGNLDVFALPVSFLEYIVANLDRITSNYWEYDVSQIFIDPDLSAGAEFDGVDDTQFVAPRDDSALDFLADPLGLASVATVFRSSDGNTSVLEMSVPFPALGITPEVGSQFGMDLVVSDQTSDTGIELANQLGWSPAGNMSTPADFLVVELGEALSQINAGDVPNALLDDSVILSEDEEFIYYESDWFGAYAINKDSVNTNYIYTDSLGWVQFASISTPQVTYVYSFVLQDMLFINATNYPLYAYAYIMETWLFLEQSNDITNGFIWAWNYSAGEWQQFFDESAET